MKTRFKACDPTKSVLEFLFLFFTVNKKLCATKQNALVIVKAYINNGLWDQKIIELSYENE
jgi:hypothetical protein